MDEFDIAIKPPRHRGIKLIESGIYQFPNLLEYCDAIRVDFDRHSIGPNGLYLFEFVEREHVNRRGCFLVNLLKNTNEILVDWFGDGNFQTLPDLDAMNLRITGFVEQIYKPTIMKAGM